MKELELVRFKINKSEKIKNYDYIEVNSITTVVGNNRDKQRELFTLLKSVNSFSSTTKERIEFNKKVIEEETEIILEYKCSDNLFEIFKKVLNDNEKMLENSIKIAKLRDNKYVINLFEQADEIEIYDSPKMQIIDLLKSNIPRFEEVKYDNYFKLSDIKFNSSDILIFEGLEKYCVDNKLELIDFCKKQFNENMIIHTTVPPYIVSDNELETAIIDSDDNFKTETVISSKNKFDYETKIIFGSMIMSVIIMIFRICHYFNLKVFNLNKIDPYIIFDLGKPFLIEYLILILICIIVILLNYYFLKEGKLKTIIWSFFIGITIGLIETLIVVCALSLVIIVVLLIAFLISILLYIFAISGMFDIISNIYNLIPESYRNLWNCIEYNMYIISLIGIIFIPYFSNIVLYLIKRFLPDIYKLKPVMTISNKIFNFETMRMILYVIAFIIYFVANCINNSNLNIIKEAFLTWIILDVIIFNIYSYFKEKNIKDKKRTRLKLVRKLLSIFNDSLLEKNKFEILEIFSNFINSEEFGKYFKSSKNVKIDRELRYNKDYFYNIFFRIWYFNKKSILTNTEFKKYISELIKIIENKEIDILTK